jgi:selenocysteine lyase/cysteine desulfurase
VVSPFLPDAEKLAAVREALPATAAGIYLDTPVAGPLPAETAAAMAEVADWELRVGRGGRDTSSDMDQRIDEARAAVGAILGTDLDRIALTGSTSTALAMLGTALVPRPTGRLVTVAAEHCPAVAGLAEMLVAGGIEGTTIDADLPPVDLESAVEAALPPAGGLVVVPHVSSATGAVLPVAGIVARARARGAMVVVDGSQAAGAIPVDVEGLGADAYLVPSHAWLLGPAGIAAVALSSQSAAAVRPVLAMLARAELPRATIVGLARSCGWSTMYVGLDWQQARSNELARRARTALAAMAGVDVLTPADRHASIITFRIQGWSPERALDELGGRIFAIASAIPERMAIRIGLGFFISEVELGRFVEAVAELAAHTPATLPPRRRLTILGSGA